MKRDFFDLYRIFSISKSLGKLIFIHRNNIDLSIKIKASYEKTTKLTMNVISF